MTEKYNPYENNQGTTLALNKNNKIIIAADKRLCTDYTFYTDNYSRIFIINNFILTGSGFQADLLKLVAVLKEQINLYEIENERKISIAACAHLLMNILYSKRFFPYYVFTTLAGEGKIFSYDPVGSYKEEDKRVYGSGQYFLQPVIDSVDLTEETIVGVYRRAARRDVAIGSVLETVIIENGKIEKREYKIR